MYNSAQVYLSHFVENAQYCLFWCIYLHISLSQYKYHHNPYVMLGQRVRCRTCIKPTFVQCYKTLTQCRLLCSFKVGGRAVIKASLVEHWLGLFIAVCRHAYRSKHKTWINIDLMLDQRRRRWLSLKSTSYSCTSCEHVMVH